MRAIDWVRSIQLNGNGEWKKCKRKNRTRTHFRIDQSKFVFLTFYFALFTLRFGKPSAFVRNVDKYERKRRIDGKFIVSKFIFNFHVRLRQMCAKGTVKRRRLNEHRKSHSACAQRASPFQSQKFMISFRSESTCDH